MRTDSDQYNNRGLYASPSVMPIVSITVVFSSRIHKFVRAYAMLPSIVVQRCKCLSWHLTAMHHATSVAEWTDLIGRGCAVGFTKFCVTGTKAEGPPGPNQVGLALFPRRDGRLCGSIERRSTRLG